MFDRVEHLIFGPGVVFDRVDHPISGPRDMFDRFGVASFMVSAASGPEGAQTSASRPVAGFTTAP